jgi:hypothetical protein
MLTGLLITTVITAVLVAALAGAYRSGALNPYIDQLGVYFFKAKAKAEEKKLQAQGLKEGQDFLASKLAAFTSTCPNHVRCMDLFEFTAEPCKKNSPSDQAEARLQTNKQKLIPVFNSRRAQRQSTGQRGCARYWKPRTLGRIKEADLDLRWHPATQLLQLYLLLRVYCSFNTNNSNEKHTDTPADYEQQDTVPVHDGVRESMRGIEGMKMSQMRDDISYAVISMDMKSPVLF